MLKYDEKIKGSENTKCCMCDWWDRGNDNVYGWFFKGKYYCPTHAREIPEPVDVERVAERKFKRRLGNRMKKWKTRLSTA